MITMMKRNLKTNKIIVKYLGQSFTLTERSMECLMLICLGLPKKHIASRLGISYRTAEKHITNAKNKLGIHSQCQLLDFVFSSQIAPYSHAATTANASKAHRKSAEVSKTEC